MIRQLWDEVEAGLSGVGARPALRIQDQDISFDSLLREAAELSYALERAGVSRDRAVALLLHERLTRPLLALWKVGSPAALLSPKYAASELTAIMRGTGISQCVVDAAQAPKLIQMLGRGETVSLPLGFALVNLGPMDPNPALAGAALLKFTSGSTGEPKGIVLGPDAVRWEARNVIETLGISPEDRILASVPVYHSYGFDLGVLPCLFAGARLILQDFFVPRRITSDLVKERITLFLGVPSLYRRWIEGGTPIAEPVAGLRYLLSCTAPLDAATIQAFHDRFQMPICQHYGSSETGAVTNHVPHEILTRPHSIGLPMKNVTLRICAPDGREVPVGEEGEVVVESHATARGYVMGAPERSPFREDGFWTGDLGMRDEKGFVTLRGRLGQIINVNGFKVSPDEVRQVLEAHPAVREAGVFGIQNGSGEQIVAALVAIKSDATEKDLIAFCFGKLADYKVPRRIEFCDELPRGASGKVRLLPMRRHA
jgi:long-chain acyl-CoA synthetase